MAVDAFKFGLSDAKIAVWNGVEDYGTAIDVESVQAMVTELITENGTLEGDDIYTDVHAKVQAARLRIRFAFKDLAVISAMTGVTHTESGANSDSMVIGRDNMKFFACCGKADGTTIAGDTQIFLPKCKLMEGFSLSMEKGQYMTPELEAMAVFESDTYGILKICNNAAGVAVTIPPTGYAG